jgi:hypothetical protein
MASSAPLTLARWLFPLCPRKLPPLSPIGVSAKGHELPRALQ